MRLRRRRPTGPPRGEAPRPARPLRHGAGNRRIPVVVVLVAALAALALVEVDDGAPEPVGSVAAYAMPVADEPQALSSTWFCAASQPSGGGGEASLVLLVANGSDERRSGTVTWMPAGADPVAQPLEIAPREGLALSASDTVTAEAVSAVVEVDGGGVAVDHAVEPAGAVAPCSSSASDRWYLANGATTVDASQTLSLFNPFPDDAIVDVTFATEQGRDEPEALQGLPVPARSTTRVEVGEAVRRREVTATSVIARRGRLVVDRLQRFDGSEGRTGVALTLAAPAPAEVWTFPDGGYEEGLSQRWHVYNPADRDAVVIIEVVPDSGDIPIPVERTVPARSQLVVDAAETALVPARVGHSSTVRSVNGVPVVAERALSGSAPASRRGWSSMLGSPLGAARWLVPGGEGLDQVADRLVVHNPGAGVVRFTVTALDGERSVAVEGLAGVDLGPAARTEVALSQGAGSSPPVLVEADGPVVVERDLSPAVDVGISPVLGLPAPPGRG